MSALLHGLEVAKRNTYKECWIVIERTVYDVTDFLRVHPGGAALILKYGGKVSNASYNSTRAIIVSYNVTQDATEAYYEVHDLSVVQEYLPSSKIKGIVDLSTLPSNARSATYHVDERHNHEIPLSTCINLDDFAVAAYPKITERAKAYISSAAASLHSLHNNRDDWPKVTFRPRVMTDVTDLDTSCKMLGQRSSYPFFIAPTGILGIVRRKGELCLAEGAARSGIHYCVSTVSTTSRQEIMENHTTESKKHNSTSVLFFQLYVHSQKSKALETIATAKALGYKGLFITVDTPVVGKREADQRLRAHADLEGQADIADEVADATDPVKAGRSTGTLSMSLNWGDLVWIRKAWEGPIVIKGIQCVDDARLAMENGVEAIYLSNHGGRQLDSAPSSISTLLALQLHLPEVFDRCEIYVDGGVTRGTDVVKALCLGARAVGIGRPFLYAMGAYGTRGVNRAIEILKEEVDTTMRLVGTTKASNLTARHVNTGVLERTIFSALSKL
ncbi:hypothetical protein B7463_g12151, partial [Scytalidium lignicola]